MIAALALLVTAAVPFRFETVDTKIHASIADDLSTVRVRVTSKATPAAARSTIIFAADRYWTTPPKLRAPNAKELYAGGYEYGGFKETRIEPCANESRETMAGGETAIDCDAAPEVVIETVLAVPYKYGAFARHGGELVLAAGWYPYLARMRGRHEVTIELPAGTGAVIGGAYFAPAGEARRTITHVEPETTMVPLIVLPATAIARPADDQRRALYIARNHASAHSRTAEQMIATVRDGLSFLREEELAWPEPSKPWLIVEAPLRHELAITTRGPILTSDRAFRIFPAQRFFRFHRFPVLREVFTGWAIDRLERIIPPGSDRRASIHVSADAIGAWMVDRYVESRFGSRESAFDVLSFWSFIPAIDSMLYAPDLPFVGAYFRFIEESDPLSPNVLDFPLQLPRGKIIYEKLIDRAGREQTKRVLEDLLAGASLEDAISRVLGGDTQRFLDTWLRPYPDVRYAIADHRSEPADPSACGGKTPCYLARVDVSRDGEAIAEPVQVLLRDDEGVERIVSSTVTAEPVRTITATLAAPLDFVELDPRGRLAERPSESDPSPHFDNVSSPRWKILLNNFNIQLLATEKSIDTAIDLGISRVHDVRWSFAVRGDYDPAAAALSGRALYGFGRAVTPARLAEWVGLIVEGAYLRPDFGQRSDGCGEAPDARAVALSGALTYAYDDRQTIWAPDEGTAIRGSLEYNRVFGELAECEDGQRIDVSRDSVSASIRGLKQWRLDGAHQISLRGKLGSFLIGNPREQLLFRLGGRFNVRGYTSGGLQGRTQAIASAEWIHTLLPEENVNAFEVTWGTKLDGAIYGDVALMADGLDALDRASPFADVGYGFRIYIDYFGVRPGVMAIDIAFPLVDLEGRAKVGPPAVYIDFSQSFTAF